jgi:autotransporter-associated beta strand protein
MPSFPTLSLLARLLVLGSLLSATSTRGQVLDYDADTLIPGAQDGAGEGWNTVSTNLWNGAANLAWPNTANDVIRFGVGSGAAGTVTVGTVNANGLVFDLPGSGTYTLAGGVITLAGANPTITTHTNATVSSTLAGSAGLTKAGLGALTVGNANTYLGGTRVQAGRLIASADGSFGAVSALNPITLDGGTLAASANITLNANHPLVLGAGGGTLTGTGSNGFLGLGANMLQGSGALQITGNSSTHTVLQVGAAQPGFSGPITLASGRINVSNAAATLGTGTITVQAGSASLYVSAAATLANPFALTGNGGENRGAVRLQSGGTLNGPITLNGNAGISVEGGGTGHLNGDVTGAFTLQLGGLTGSGAGATYNLNGNNNHSGTTLGNGTLNLGQATGLGSSAAVVTVNGGTLNLNGHSVTVGNLAAGNAAGAITDNAAAPGTSVLNLGAQTATVATRLLDGPNRALQVRIANANSAAGFASSSANTFSGGLVLLHNPGPGTRLTISSVLTSVGAPGAITSSPFGRGAIVIGEAPTDRAGIYFHSAAGSTVLNDILMNTRLGSDRPGLRSDTTNINLAGTLTANQADFTLSTNGTGSFNLTGQVTGAHGLRLSNAFGTTITVTLQNAAQNNNYAGDTTLEGTRAVLVLGAADQIPNGPGTGDLVNHGTVRLAGFSETVNGLSGNGTVNGLSGTPTLTVGDRDATATFNGVLQNTAGTLSITKIGAGTQTLSGSNTFSGDLTLTAGTLRAGSATALGATAGTTRVVGGILDVNGQNLGGEPIDLAGGKISNHGAAQINALQRVTVSADSTIGGAARWDVRSGTGFGLTVNPGVTLVKEDANAIAVVNNPLVNDGLIRVEAGIFAAHWNVTSSGSGTFEVRPGAELQIGSFGTPVTIHNGVVVEGGILSGVNSQNGPSVFAGSLTLAGAAVTTVRTDADLRITGPIDGSGSLTKTGGAILTLTGTGTQAGDTVVSAGTLALDGALPAGGLITVDPGASLAGSGAGGLVTVLGGATLSPGGAADHHFDLAGLSLSASSVLRFDLDAPLADPLALLPDAASDHITVSGALHLDGQLRINPLANFAPPDVGDRWLLLRHAPGNLSGPGLTVDTANAPVLPAGQSYRIDTDLPGFVYLTVVPEPATGTLLLAGLWGFRRLWRARR